jgi:hypothetical protein
VRQCVRGVGFTDNPVIPEVHVTVIKSARSVLLYATIMVAFSILFASAHANQDGAPDGFILFSTDRDSTDADNPSSEEIYVMLPDGTHSTRITDNAFNDKAPVWSHSKKLIASIAGRTADKRSS